MDTSVDNQNQTISDDQELAKALAGVTQEANDLNFEETSPASAPAPAFGGQPAMGLGATSVDPVQAPVIDAPMTSHTQASSKANAPVSVDPALASVKEAALTELRPLIDKLDVEPEEKFNTYLLLIRSTDDKDLIAPAHEAAKSITDETKKAQALLDIIKEIDFLSNPQQ